MLRKVGLQNHPESGSFIIKNLGNRAVEQRKQKLLFEPNDPRVCFPCLLYPLKTQSLLCLEQSSLGSLISHGCCPRASCSCTAIPAPYTRTWEILCRTSPTFLPAQHLQPWKQDIPSWVCQLASSVVPSPFSISTHSSGMREMDLHLCAPLSSWAREV